MNCDICGRDAPLYTILVEGSELKVCERCSSTGKIIKKPEIALPIKKSNKQEPIKKAKTVKELVETIVEDYATRIRKAREKTGMTQKEFAKKINEKESIVHKLETGSFEPPVALAKKLEKLLKIKLIEQTEQEKEIVQEKKEKSEGLTIGDILKIK
ncbi:MAG: multiprotein bridging factor aMBF1 [Candidatus Woesearchaeota archaeon]